MYKGPGELLIGPWGEPYTSTRSRVNCLERLHLIYKFVVRCVLIDGVTLSTHQFSFQDWDFSIFFYDFVNLFA